MKLPTKWFVLVGGINGAGKSTFAQARSLGNLIASDKDDFEIINPDLVTSELRQTFPAMSTDQLNLMAAEICEARVRELIDSGNRSFAIETVLSTDKYKPIVQRALLRG